jgi:hypothetical protein
MTAEVAKIVLVNHKLRWSSPLLFDDIFDVQRDFDLGFDIEELKKPLEDEVRNLISAIDIPDLSSQPRVEWFVKCLRREDCSDIRNTILKELPILIDEGIQHMKNNSYKEVKEQWSKLIPDFRILCFSEECDNLPMWSLYSDSHKGTVIELQCINELDSAWLIAQPVIYQDSPPILATKEEWIKSITGQKPLNVYHWKFYEPYTVTKTTDWGYQKEWRIVSFSRPRESGHYSNYGFSPREIRSVYLGCEISDEDANDIISLLNHELSHVRAYQAKKLEHERKLSFERIK